MRDVAAGKTAANVKTGKYGRAIVDGGKGTATRTVGLLGGIFTFAISREMRADNPVRGVKRYADRKSETFLSPAQLAALGAALSSIEVAGSNWCAIAIIRMLAFTGARKGEIVSLRWDEVDFDRGYLALANSKTGAKIIPVGAPAMEVLAKLPRIDGSSFVFPATSGTNAFQGVDKVWRRVRTLAGFPKLRLHDLRHSYASAGLARGDTLSVIGAILGHKDVKTTSRYAHLAADPVKKAADDISRGMHAALKSRRVPNVVQFRSTK